MHDDHDTPAALPLIALIAGLAIGPQLINPLFTIAGLTAIFLLRRRTFLLFAMLGVALTLRARVAPSFDPERFVDLEVPIEHDWTPRDDAFVLRASRFRANGIDVDLPITLYARFEPPDVAMQATLHAQAFVQTSERGNLHATIKASQLMSYSGDVARWRPSTWNRMLAQRLARRARDYPDEVALAQALLLGRGERLSNEMRESFRRGGTYHLLVFSGMQIALAAAAIAMLLRWLHRPRASDRLLLVFALLAPIFIGATPSVSRASIAIGLYALSRILHRPTSLENLWCVAALLRLIVAPEDLTDISFHLTYAGAGALLFVGKHFKRPFGHLVAAEVAITPLTLFHFHQYALGGSLVTLAMSPLILAMLLISAIACAWPHDLVFETIRALHRLCTLLNAFGFAGWFASPPLLALLIGATAALFALALLRDRKRAIAISAALLIPTVAAIVTSARASHVDAPHVTFLDVGQGDAIAIRTRSRTILIDGGRNDRVLALLADRGVRKVDVAILTHAHPDHCTGLARIVAEMRVGALWISPQRFRGDCATLMLDAARTSHTPIHLVRDGDSLTFDDVQLTAHIAQLRFRRAPENNSSIVLRATIDSRTFLFTGDIEKEAELVLADEPLRADVLKVAHHGSKTSTSPRFLAQVAPRIAVISCGRRNLFGHPHPAVLDALRDRGVRILRTDRDGSVDIEVRDHLLYARSAID